MSPPLVRLAVLILVVLAALGAVVYFFSDPEPPTQRFEQVIPNDRFAR